jgi:SAM-dependent methyltransferase
MSINWKEFWNFSYRQKDAKTESDLFFQVGKTINKQPVEKKVFELMITEIHKSLSIRQDDVLLDLCCGNGLLTFELSSLVNKVYAVDFSENLIDTAKKMKNKPNVQYFLGDIVEELLPILDNIEMPNKILMNVALAYFTPSDLKKILRNLNTRINNYTFLITEVPNDDLKWNFYNTEERKKRYFAMRDLNDDSNDGLGRWWSPLEIEEICKELDLSVNIENQNPDLSNYRMNILIKKNNK